MNSELNLRDLGGLPTAEGKVPKGLYFRSGKLSILSPKKCARLMKRYHIGCVIDLRTPVEAAEFPDPLPQEVEYLQIPLLKDAAVGITHETGSDPMTILKNLRKQPEKIWSMIPDLPALYKQIVTDEYSTNQLNHVLDKLRKNAHQGIPTLVHCTAGKDRTGIVSMALLKEYGASDEVIIRDFMRTNHSALLPTLKKCIGVFLITRNWQFVRIAYDALMAHKEHILIALQYYQPK